VRVLVVVVVVVVVVLMSMCALLHCTLLLQFSPLAVHPIHPSNRPIDPSIHQNTQYNTTHARPHTHARTHNTHAPSARSRWGRTNGSKSPRDVKASTDVAATTRMGKEVMAQKDEAGCREAGVGSMMPLPPVFFCFFCVCVCVFF
jgi:hypothetical protein